MKLGPKEFTVVHNEEQIKQLCEDCGIYSVEAELSIFREGGKLFMGDCGMIYPTGPLYSKTKPVEETVAHLETCGFKFIETPMFTEEEHIRSILPYYIADLYHPETLEIPCNELAYIIKDFLSRNEKIDKKVKEILEVKNS